MKPKSVLATIAITEQGRALLQEVLVLRETTLVAMADANVPDNTIRYLSGKLSIYNEFINQLQDKR